MPDMESISTTIDFTRKFVGLAKDIVQFVGEQNNPKQTRELREILLSFLHAIDETERYSKLAKKHNQRNFNFEMAISNQWQEMAEALAGYIEANHIPMHQEINLNSLRQACDFKAKGWLDPESVGEFDVEIYRSSLKEMRKTIKKQLDSLDNQIFMERG